MRYQFSLTHGYPSSVDFVPDTEVLLPVLAYVLSAEPAQEYVPIRALEQKCHYEIVSPVDWLVTAFQWRVDHKSKKRLYRSSLFPFGMLTLLPGLQIPGQFDRIEFENGLGHLYRLEIELCIAKDDDDELIRNYWGNYSPFVNAVYPCDVPEAFQPLYIHRVHSQQSYLEAEFIFAAYGFELLTSVGPEHENCHGPHPILADVFPIHAQTVYIERLAHQGFAVDTFTASLYGFFKGVWDARLRDANEKWPLLCRLPQEYFLEHLYWNVHQFQGEIVGRYETSRGVAYEIETGILRFFVLERDMGYVETDADGQADKERDLACLFEIGIWLSGTVEFWIDPYDLGLPGQTLSCHEVIPITRQVYRPNYRVYETLPACTQAEGRAFLGVKRQ